MTTIAVSMGDPLGIGPEVLLKAVLADKIHERCRLIVFGGPHPLAAAADRAGVASPFTLYNDSPVSRTKPGAYLVARRVNIADTADLDSFGLRPGNNMVCGRLSYEWVMGAVGSCKMPPEHPMSARTMVTGPISKRAWDMAGFGRYPGHTELLDEQLGSGDAVMYFLGPRLNVALVTVHIPLSAVPGELTPSRVLSVITQAEAACRRLGPGAGDPNFRPRVGVCGLNPHAGEDGLLGTEERQMIEPAIAAARARGLDVTGPISGDSIFLDALKPAGGGAKGARQFDLYIAMYHDQGLIPVKLLDRDMSVNITLGLKHGVVRTSPAHGTAFDIAGTNRADPTSMIEALRAAERLAGLSH